MKRFKKDLMKYRKYMIYSAKAELKAEVATFGLVMVDIRSIVIYACICICVFHCIQGEGRLLYGIYFCRCDNMGIF